MDRIYFFLPSIEPGVSQRRNVESNLIQNLLDKLSNIYILYFKRIVCLGLSQYNHTVFFVELKLCR